MLKIFVLTGLLLVSAISIAQNSKNKADAPDNKDMARYLDDGRVKNVSNLLRFRVGPTALGYVGLSYERKFGRKFGLEVGAYFKVTPFHYFENFRLEDASYGTPDFGSISVSSTKGGMGYMVYPKLYITGKKINKGYFFGLRATYRNFVAEIDQNLFYTSSLRKEAEVTSTGFVLTAGSHQHVNGRFVWGLEWGLGVVKDEYKKLYEEVYDPNTSIHGVRESKNSLEFLSVYPTIDMVFGFLF